MNNDDRTAHRISGITARKSAFLSWRENQKLTSDQAGEGFQRDCRKENTIHCGRHRHNLYFRNFQMNGNLEARPQDKTQS